MNEYEQQEQREKLEERIKNLDEMEMAARAKIYRDSMRNQERVTQRMFDKALKKYGMTQAEFTRLAMEHPEETMESLYENIKGHTKRLASFKGKPKDSPRMRPASSRTPRQEPRRSTDYEELKEKAARGRITDDDLLAHLSKIL